MISNAPRLAQLHAKGKLLIVRATIGCQGITERSSWVRVQNGIAEVLDIG
jgi:hypothetical protein